MIAILLALLVLGGITFAIIIFCLVKAKTQERPFSHAGPRVRNEEKNDASIEMKTNEAYGPISGGKQQLEPEYEVV